MAARCQSRSVRAWRASARALRRLRGISLGRAGAVWDGGGVTFYELNRDFTVHEVSAIAVGGMEVEQCCRRTDCAAGVRETTNLTANGVALPRVRARRVRVHAEDRATSRSALVMTCRTSRAVQRGRGGRRSRAARPRTLRRQTLINLANPDARVSGRRPRPLPRDWSTGQCRSLPFRSVRFV